jgi:diguanylate cyclase (GGDEF)-like protein
MNAEVVLPDLKNHDFTKTEKLFLSQLKYNEDIEGVYVGGDSGSFFYVQKGAESSLNEYTVKLFLGDGKRNEWSGSAHGSNAPLKKEELDNYDPRSRPWYKKAKAKRSIVWTSPYIFNTSKKLGVTVSSPIMDENGSIIGVVGIDIRLEKLIEFLDRYNINDLGSLFMSTNAGFLIASSTRFSKDVEQEKFQDDYAQKISNAIDRGVVDLTKKGGDIFEINGAKNIVAYTSLDLPGGDTWTIGAFAPSGMLLSEIKVNERRNIIISCFILAISMLVGYLLTKKAWAPVEKLHEQATTDQLTKLKNRHFLEIAATNHIRTARQLAQPLTVAVLDIDKFKDVNDENGHDAGDEILVEFSRRLIQQFRAFDIVARYGGEEFVLILPSTDTITAKQIVRRAMTVMSESQYSTQSGDLTITFSGGLAELSKVNNTFETLFSEADKALYRAKEAGRNRVL